MKNPSIKTRMCLGVDCDDVVQVTELDEHFCERCDKIRKKGTSFKGGSGFGNWTCGGKS